MYTPRKQLATPIDFGFPYEPYDIQQQLMQEVFKVLEDKQIGIFESPTGTGKSLTLTCGALTWLEQHEALVRSELQERIAQVEQEVRALQSQSEYATDWISAQSECQKQKHELLELHKLRDSLREREAQLAAVKERQAQLQKHKKPHRKTDGDKPKDTIDELEYHVDDVDLNVSNEDDLDAEDANADDDDDESKLSIDEERFRDVQIFYCSRTHSQLAQIVTELQKTRFGKTVRCISLASRQQLCINAQVRRLNNSALINERCLDMAKSKTTSGAGGSCAKKQCLGIANGKIQQKLSKCEYKTTTALQTLSDLTLSEVCDIEDLVTAGKSLQACPYYGVRQAQPLAQLVLLPYQMLLQRNTRQQHGIDIRGAVIIIDEAHNLLDTIAHMQSCELTLQQLQMARDQINAYKKRYAQRFSAANMLRINQLCYVVKRLCRMLEAVAPEVTQRLLRTYELAAEGDFFNINLYDLLTFCTRTRFAQKVQSFAQQQQYTLKPNENEPPTAAEAGSGNGMAASKTTTLGILQRLAQAHQTSQITPAMLKRKRKQLEEDEAAKAALKPKSKPSATTATAMPMPSVIRPLLAFLETLTTNADDGRVLITPTTSATSQATFKYLLLNPGEHFADIVREARAIIIAGGTMQPTQELNAQLFHTCAARVRERFYGHVVPHDAVLPFVLTRGPTGRALCFNYAQRSSAEMLKELTMLLQNLCFVLPAGLVCFLPSYQYLNTVFETLQSSGILARIAQRKRVFRELASASASAVDELLQSYAKAIRAPQSGGALMLSVVGGKLSEGLNFADDLGRGVIVVGLPYPNSKTPELQERMRYLDVQLGSGSGKEYYENLCMKAVNQCIGRSVRHIRDYACVYLVDERYASAQIQTKLPSWIARAIETPANGHFGAVIARTARFFKLRRAAVEIESKKL